MTHTIFIETNARESLYDITEEVCEFVEKSEIESGIANIYVKGATAAIMIQENWDESVQTDVVNLLRKLIPHGTWLHDKQDGNGDAHLKAGIVGPSETIPIREGFLALSEWQNIFLCEFDGPRERREIEITLISTK
ncbi:MAG: YjbQ family protein [Spirochaetales bacterium]|nr:YjbQ family protein [Spirochaetales bacterium]